VVSDTPDAGASRAVAVVGLADVGLIRLLDISGKFEETP
jgi:hypothetical protein